MSVMRIKIAESDIVEFFNGHSLKVFKKGDVAKILKENREDWRLAKNMRILAFIDYFTRKGKMREIKIYGKYFDTARYNWSDTSDFNIALSLKKDSHISHYSAMLMHSITEQIPKTIYVNFEQPPKPKPKGELIQENIDRVFKGKARLTSNVVVFNEVKTILINGKHTGLLGIVKVPYSGEELPCTDLERTLIDIVVRPDYSGGPWEILKAYKNAKHKFSTNRLVSYYKKLNYIYPYHQIIGFLLQRAGYKKEQWELFKDMGLDYNFYIAYGMKEVAYVKEWKLFVPKGF